jgi:hypothetical protein
MEALKIATEDYRKCAVVRGLFKDSKASKKWVTNDYLPSRFQDFSIPIVKDARVGTLQNDRVLVNFTDSFHEMMASRYSTEYLFFPVKSRFTFAGIPMGFANVTYVIVIHITVLNVIITML